MRYVTYCNSLLNGLTDVDIHPNKDSAIRFYRTNAKRYFDGLELPVKTVPPTACGFYHRQFGIMSIRRFQKTFPEWKGGGE